MIPSRIRTPLALATMLVLAATVGCKKPDTTLKPQKTGPSEPVPTDVVAAVSKPMPNLLTVSGTLQGEREAQLAASANGKVLRSFLDRGRAVKAGDVLLVLDTRSAQLAAKEARANVDLVEAQATIALRECERYKSLLASGAISQAEYDKVTDSCRTTALNLGTVTSRAEMAFQNVVDGVVKAPFTGVIDDRYVEVGEFVRQDTKVARLVVPDPLRLRFTLPEAYLANAKEGESVTFHVAAYGKDPFRGTVKFVSPAVRESTRDVVVEAMVDNADRRLRPGMFAQVDVKTGESVQAVIPRSSVYVQDGNDRVRVVTDGRVQERLVQLGAVEGDQIAVLRGVQKGDSVVRIAPASDARTAETRSPGTDAGNGTH